MDRVIEALSSTRAITTDQRPEHALRGRRGRIRRATNPAYVYTVIDSGPNAASPDDIKVLTDSLGYVLSQGSAFLLDADNPSSFDFPANYVVLNFAAPPPLAASAALFKTVGRIDPELFETDTSGYTQYGRAYLSLQSAVPDAAVHRRVRRGGRRRSASSTRRSSTGSPRCFREAPLPGQRLDPEPPGRGIPVANPATAHSELGRIRAFHLRATRKVLRRLEHEHKRPADAGGIVRLPG